MTAAAVDRISILEEAVAIERAGGDWTVRHVCAVLGCHKASLYRNRVLMSRSILQPGGRAFKPTNVRLYQSLNTGVTPREKSA